MNPRFNEGVGKTQELATKPLQTKKLYLGRDVKPASMKSIDEHSSARDNKTPPKSKLSNRLANDDNE